MSERGLYEDAYCIENVNVIDPLEGLVDHMNLVIKDNKIYRIGKRDDLKWSRKNNIIDGKD
jgi:dihydroorotase-like cyclic amidohydrolase